MQSRWISRTVGNLIGHIKTSIKQNKIFLQLSLRNTTPCKKKPDKPAYSEQTGVKNTNRFPSYNKERPHVHAELERHTYQPTLIYDQTSPIRDRAETHSWNAETKAPHQRFFSICLFIYLFIFLKKHATLNFINAYLDIFFVMRTSVARQHMGKERGLHDRQPFKWKFHNFLSHWYLLRLKYCFHTFFDYRFT